MTDRRSFVAWLGSLPLLRRRRSLSRAPILIEATPTALYQQPDGRNNLVRVAVTGLDAPAARARLTDRRGTLVACTGSPRATRRSGSPSATTNASNCIAKTWMRRWPE